MLVASGVRIQSYGSWRIWEDRAFRADWGWRIHKHKGLLI